MKRLFIIFIYIGISINTVAQWSIFVGGGANMTTNGGQRVYYYKSKPSDNSLSLTPSYGGYGEVGCSYLFKKHFLFRLSFNFSYQEYNTSYKTVYTHFGVKTVLYDDFYDFFYSISIPIIFGYSFVNKSKNFYITPYVGWVNQVVPNRTYMQTAYNYNSLFIGSPKIGARLRYKGMYFDFNCERSVTRFGSIYPKIRLLVVNMGIGYVYTFKKKEKHPK